MRIINLRQNYKNPFKGILNFCFLNFQILKGKISYVGAPLTLESDKVNNIIYKPGITGLIQLNSSRNIETDEIKNYDVYYLKNQNFWLDMEIIFRSVFRR